MVAVHLKSKYGRQFPPLVATSLCDCFLPRVSFAAGVTDGRIGLLSKDGDIVDCIDIPRTLGLTKGRVRAMSISPLDGTVAIAPFYSPSGRVVWQRASATTCGTTSIPGDVFGLAFVASKSLLAIGHVNADDEASVTIFDYVASNRVASHGLRALDAVDYMDYEIRSVECEMAVSSDGLTFGAADGFIVLALDLRDGETLFKKRVQPSGVVFSPEADILTAACNDFSIASEPSLRLDCFEVPSGNLACHHAMHGKCLKGTALACPMLYCSLGLVLFFDRRMVLISPSGDVLLDMQPFQRAGPVIALAEALVPSPERSAKCVNGAYEVTIDAVRHDEDPATVGEAEAAEVVSQQHAGFVEKHLRGMLRPDENELSRKTFLCTLNRCPKGLRNLLCNGPELRPVREALGAQKWMGPGGSLVFVETELFEEVMDEVAKLDMELKPSHLVVSDAYAYLVDEVIDQFKQVWCKSNEVLCCGEDKTRNLAPSVASDEQDTFGGSASAGDNHANVETDDRAHDQTGGGAFRQLHLSIENTFVHVVDNEADDGHWTESTTEAHCPQRRNPRKPSRQLRATLCQG